MRNNKKILIVGIITLLVMVGVIGGAFAYFIFANTGENQVLVAGDVFMKYTESNTVINAELMMPRSEYDPETYFEFTIEGKNTHNQDLYYEILINHGEDHETRKTRLDDKFLRFRLEEIVGEEVTPVIEEGTYEEISNTKIWVNTIKANTKTKTSIKYRLYMWITDEVNISDSGDYTNEVWNNQVFASIKVSVNGDFEEKDINIIKYPEAAEKILSKAKRKDYVYDKDNVLYFSGTNEEINFNYVWYSGKLWRITAINPDGSMKLVTQDEITAIPWNINTTYKDSWIYQWLNEDFKDTLYSYEEIIVQNADWNATEDGNSKPVKPPTDESATMVTGDVGLLNAYEYSQACKNAGTSTNYLNIGYYWWLITPKDSSNVREVFDFGNSFIDASSTDTSGVRPSINLKPNVIILVGDGSKNNPYRISGDKEPGNSGEFINTRLSGEYVKVDNKIYRIVGIENNTTKLTSVDYIRDNDVVLTKKFGTSTNWKYSVTSGNNDYWGYYLNNTWLASELQKYITDGIYYLGSVGSSSSSTGNYKNSICNERNTTEPTSSCGKTESIWTGKVGLPRVGEMFSAQLGRGTSSSSSIWLITPIDYYSFVWLAGYRGTLIDGYSPSSSVYGARPSIYLKSEVKITGGDGMSPDSAYEISL